jgi:phosphoglycolate phosphatase-like HAD superfamily hydrolase
MKRAEARLVWLFDVDGTLLWTDGAAREAFAQALGEHFGLRDDLGDIAFGGRTDPLILGEIVRKHALVLAEGEEPRFWARVYAHMNRLLVPGRGRLLPGVEALLRLVQAEPGWVRALLTGNNREMARLKLGHFGLDESFEFGAFGDDGTDRNAVARVAVRRAAERTGLAPERCIVVGDTEHDVACARAAGARVVAVATGARTRAELAPHAPDLLLDDLADPAPLMEWARAIG